MEKFVVENFKPKKHVNYDVYNALNLYNEKLGISHEKRGFNPFGEGFELTEGFVMERCYNNSKKGVVISPEFIEKGAISSEIAFENSLKNCKKMLKAFNKMGTAERKKITKLKVCTSCHVELLNIYLKELTEKSDFLQMYRELCALDWQLAKIFEQTYKNKFDLDLAIRQYHELRASYARAQEDTKLKEITNRIIQTNQQNKAAQAQAQAQAQVQPRPAPTSQQNRLPAPPKLPPPRPVPPKPRPRPAVKSTNAERDL